MKENERFYGFTDLRGKPEKRGRERHASANQVTAAPDTVLYCNVTSMDINT